MLQAYTAAAFPYGCAEDSAVLITGTLCECEAHLARLAMAIRRSRVAGAASDTLELVLLALGEIDSDRKELLLKDPILWAWLSRAEHLLSDLTKADVTSLEFIRPRLDEQIAQLAFFGLPLLLAVTRPGDSFPVGWPACGHVGPFGVSWTLQSLSSTAITATAHRTATGAVVRDAAGTLCRLEADPQLTGEGILAEVEPSRVKAMRRWIATSTGHELTCLDELPEVLGGSPRDRWVTDPITDDRLACVDSALRLLGELWPAALDDIDRFCRRIVPLRTPEGGCASIANPALPFAVGATFLPERGPLLLAELLVHEVTHLKLDLLQKQDLLVHDDGQRVFRHPWRSDLRPITGVLFGAHAFLSVMGLYRRAAQAGYETPQTREIFETRRDEVGATLDALERAAHWTEGGHLFLAQMKNAFASAASL